ncbi:retron Ec78 anti-phage system effector HNH endonuclease PtuB [Rheinheimera aquimaris]|uniref:retron Ec78 anti-phage system effector HNH endonuclease PtuB n=1 Tax=Rheinheimera aquimaris TaxID=412437 RepID=UPI0014170BE0|nr:retron Ec78 anti-phage system effector HNH endonuclease PtuB [Rheinheimera aquimaris]MCD1598533.1 TIGR02646 family protein [Rheinheimera aquimaris]
MIKISKSHPPNPLTLFSSESPDADWKDFRNLNSGNDYKLLQDLVFNDQFRLCAYCEVDTGTVPQNKRLEHFVSKSLAIHHHTDWNNILGVCVGGSDYENTKVRGYITPENLSCDAHKAFLESKYATLSRDWSGVIVNPLYLPEVHNFFSFDKAKGELQANVDYCNGHHFAHNKHDSTLELINKTIEVLNLNCARLCDARRQILFRFNSELNRALKSRDLDRLKNFATFWLAIPAKEFQTTRNIILRENTLIAKLLNA